MIIKGPLQVDRQPSGGGENTRGESEPGDWLGGGSDRRWVTQTRVVVADREEAQDWERLRRRVSGP